MRQSLLAYLCVSVFLQSAGIALAANPDAARVAGDLRVDGIHFSADGSVLTRLSDAVGPQGPTGPAGASGLNSLINLLAEPVGSNCTFGGTKVSVGLDANRNGVLDAAEVGQTKFVCNNGGIIVNGGSVVGTTAQNVTVATTWTQGRVYVVNSCISVDAPLTIQPGAVVKFKPGACINVNTNGSIVAEGTAGEPIIFTSVKSDISGDTNGDGDASAPAPGDWRGISISGAGSRFSYCTFSYGGSGDYSTLAINNQVASVTHSTFDHNGVVDDINAAPALDAGSALAGTVISNNTFYDNQVPLGISVKLSMDDSNLFSSQAHANKYQGIFVTGCGTATSNIVWSATKVPFVIGTSANSCNYIGVGATASLTLADNVVLKFFPNGSLNVDGSLVASAASRITFTSVKDDAFGGDTNGDGAASAGAPGDWRYLRFNGRGSRLNKVLLRFAGGDDSSALIVNNTAAEITNSIIAYNGTSDDINADPALDALTAKSGTVITGTTFYGNRLPLGISAAVSLDDSNQFDNGLPDALLVSNKFNGIRIDGCSTYASNVSLTTTKVPFIVGNSANSCNYLTIRNVNVTVGSGSVFKFFPNGKLDFYGTGAMPNGSNALFTSIRDDVVTDTNGDGTLTAPAEGDWHGFSVSGLPNGAPGYWIPQAGPPSYPEPAYMRYALSH